MTKATRGIQELAEQAGVSIRTLHHWTKLRVLPRPVGHGRSAQYTEGHVLRAQVIKHLREGKLALKAIHNKIAALNDEQLRALLPPDARASGGGNVSPPPPATTYPFHNWELVTLTNGLYLIVDPAQGALRRVADEIYRYYGTPAR